MSPRLRFQLFWVTRLTIQKRSSQQNKVVIYISFYSFKMARYLVAVNRNYLKNFKIGKTREFSSTKRANQTSVISSVIIFDHLLIKSNRERESCRLRIQEFYGSHSIPYVLFESSKKIQKSICSAQKFYIA